jgi:hypothetical protein
MILHRKASGGQKPKSDRRTAFSRKTGMRYGFRDHRCGIAREEMD